MDDSATRSKWKMISACEKSSRPASASAAKALVSSVTSVPH
jgi:hypothetical protein